MRLPCIHNGLNLHCIPFHQKLGRTQVSCHLTVGEVDTSLPGSEHMDEVVKTKYFDTIITHYY
jgi:hypothetical protein